MFVHRLFAVSILVLVAVGEVNAQQRPSSPRAPQSTETAELARGWQLLAQGRPAEAAKVAATLLSASPRSAPAMTLGLEASVATGGSAAAMTFYERWLGQRRVEEPAALRRIAIAALREVAADEKNVARPVALQALARDGDAQARHALEALRGTAGDVSTRALAAAGDPAAVKDLTSSLQGAGGAEGVLALEALGTSGSSDAVAAIADQLRDERSEIRGAAAEALGRLGATGQVGALRELLNDRNTYVRLKAAGALTRLGDESGAIAAREFMTHESAGVRLAAAEAMAAQPTEEWRGLVRSLLSAPEVEVQIGAARLIGPYDPDAAFTVLEGLASSENPVVRELAARATGDIETTDMTVLRRLLKNAYPLGKVRAAARVLAITR